MLLSDPELFAELEQIEDFREIKEMTEKNRFQHRQHQERSMSISCKGCHFRAEKKYLDRRKKIKDTLKKMRAKVLTFMCLTHFGDERPIHVIESLDTELFLRSTRSAPKDSES